MSTPPTRLSLHGARKSTLTEVNNLQISLLKEVMLARILMHFFRKSLEELSAEQ
jgi:hypothetical protein